jgi:hypothetical protein
MRSLVGAPLRSVLATSMANGGVYRDDNVAAQFTFEDGSVGNLIYCANGSAELSKEFAEVFCQGAAAVLDDYRSVTTYTGDKKQVKKFGSQDKGHGTEMRLLVQAVKQGGPMPIPFHELVEVTHATFAILESAAEGVRIDLIRSGVDAE